MPTKEKGIVSNNVEILFFFFNSSLKQYFKNLHRSSSFTFTEIYQALC